MKELKNLLAWILLFSAVACVMDACSVKRQSAENQLVVSIRPLQFIVEEIVGDSFEVAVLVPHGASPETYEPTPAQIKAAETSKLLFFTGLIDFERALIGRFADTGRFVDLSAGIELIGDTGTHDSSHGDHGGHGHGHSHAHGGHRGIDPHIWVSPKALRQMARTAYARIHELFPDSLSYTANYTQLAERLQALDEKVGEKIAASSGVLPAPESSLPSASSAPAALAALAALAASPTHPTRSFLIFHPGLTYYARDYGLRQIALEHDGKEPPARQLQEVIALARAEGISKVLYQKEFPRAVVEVAAAEIGAEPVEIDILGYDIVGNILKITELITGTTSSASAGSAPENPAKK